MAHENLSGGEPMRLSVRQKGPQWGGHVRRTACRL